MNEKNKKLKETAIEAMKVYREAMIDEMAKTKKELSEKLEKLCKTGFDQKYQCCLEDMRDIVEGYYPHLMKRDNVMEFKKAIDDLDDGWYYIDFFKWLDGFKGSFGYGYDEEISYSIEELRYINKFVNQVTNIDEAIRALELTHD